MGALVALRVVAAVIWPTINDVTTDTTPEYPDLKAQRFARPPEVVFAAAVAVAHEMQFETIEQSPQKGVIQAVATTPVLRFKDDVTITVHREAEQTVVNLRSHSRIGKGDLGANTRRIREFQARLAKELAGPSPAPDLRKKRPG